MTAETHAAVCANCGSALEGRYCVKCGQDSHSHRLPFRELITDAADQFFSFDGRIPRTLYLLLAKPGALTAEYIAGRRQPYVPALRLYLFVTVAFFLGLAGLNIALVQLVPYDPSEAPTGPHLAVSNDVAGTVGARILFLRPFEHVVLTDPQRTSLQKMQANLASQGEVASAEAGGHLVRLMERAYADSAAFNEAVQSWTARFLLLMMPLFALALALLRPGRFLFVDHVTFALHLHSFLFFLLFAAVGFAAVLPGRVALSLVLLSAAIYLFLSLRRAYGLGIFATSWRTAVLSIAYAIGFPMGLQGLLLLTLGS